MLRDLTGRYGRHTQLGLVALAVAMCAGCGSSDAPGVGMQTISTSVVFRAPTAATTPVPAQTAPSVPAFVAPLSPGLPAFPTFAPFSFGPFPTLPPSGAVCTKAPSTAQPDTVADVTVTTMPTKGTYRWVGTGQVTSATPAGSSVPTITLPVGIAKRYVRNVAASSTPDPAQSLPGSPQGLDYTYESIEPTNDLTNPGFNDLFWAVKTNSATPKDPEGGLALTKVEFVNGSGNQPSVTSTPLFSPPQGLLFMPLPVTPGATWTSTAADASTGVWTVAGQVLGARENVDACGQLIQAWHVHATVTIANPNPSTAATTTTLDYDVATQYGALIVQFVASGPWFGVTYSNTSFRDGQLTPEPLPSNMTST